MGRSTASWSDAGACRRACISVLLPFPRQTSLRPSSVPAQTSVTRGAARSVSLLHGSGGRLPLVPPTDSEACTHRSAGCGGPPVARSFFPAAEGGRGSRQSLGMLLLLDAPEARKSINTVIALPAQISLFLKLNPISGSAA